jgi:hypothetical protein
MSCCDGSLVQIINLSGADFSIQSHDSTVGSLHGLSSGTDIPNNGFAIGFAYSGGGTNGAASGTVTVSTSNGAYTMTLDYGYTPDSNTGSCPCTTTSQSAQSVENYVATPTTSTGNNTGEAWTVWTISSQLA